MLAIQGLLNDVLSIALLCVKIFALADCVRRNPTEFLDATQIAKNGWLVILGLAVLAHLVSWNVLGLLNLLGTVAALVYLAQMRGSRAY